MSAARRKDETVVVAGPMSPIVSMEVVERPSGRAAKWEVTKEVEAIAKTVESGKAMKLAFRTLEEMVKLQNALRHQVRAKGVEMHYKKVAKEQMIVWAEKIKSAAGEPK